MGERDGRDTSGAGDVADALALPPESRGEAPGRGRMTGRRVVVVGAGQTEYDLDEQPVGNGRAIALLLAREGARVVAVDRDAGTAQGTVDLITAEGGEATAAVADVADPSDVERAIDEALAWLGAVDGLVYNVGIPGPKGWDAADAEAFDAAMAVNLRGAVLTSRALLPRLEPRSSCVFISSIASERPPGQLLAYETAKAGLGALMRAVGFEGKARGIRSNVVRLGMIDTGLGRSANEGSPRLQALIPLGRQGTAWEVAYATTFLLSDEAAYITGQTLTIDGGRTTL